MSASPTNSSHLNLGILNSPIKFPTGSPMRVISDQLRNGPWTTQALLSTHTLTELLPSDHSFAPFLKKLNAFEEALLTSSRPEAKEQRRAVQLSLSESNTLGAATSRVSDGDNAYWGLRAEITMVYRLADILHNIFSPDKSKAPIRPGTQQPLGRNWKTLEDWPLLLTSLPDLVGKTLAEISSLDVEDSTDNQDYLLRWSRFCTTKRKGLKILSNFIDVASIIAGFNKPDEEGALLKRGNRSNSLDSVEADKADQQRRLILLHALFISPLCLFQANKTAFTTGKHALIQAGAFESLGNEKPPLIVEVEQILWLLILKLSSRELKPSDFLASLLKALPVEKVQKCTPDVRQWFIRVISQATGSHPIPEIGLGQSEPSNGKGHPYFISTITVSLECILANTASTTTMSNAKSFSNRQRKSAESENSIGLAQALNAAFNANAMESGDHISPSSPVVEEMETDAQTTSFRVSEQGDSSDEKEVEDEVLGAQMDLNQECLPMNDQVIYLTAASGQTTTTGNAPPQPSNTPPVGNASVRPILAPTPSHPKRITDGAPSSSPSQNESSAKSTSITPSNGAKLSSRKRSSGRRADAPSAPPSDDKSSDNSNERSTSVASSNGAKLSSRKRSSGRRADAPSAPPSDNESSESSDDSNAKSTPIGPSNGAKVSSREHFSRNSTKGPSLSSLKPSKPALAFSKQPPRTGAVRKKTPRSAELRAQIVGLASKKREVIDLTKAEVIDLTMDLEKDLPRPNDLPKGNFKVLRGPEIKIRGAKENGDVKVTPRFHFQNNLDAFMNIIKVAQAVQDSDEPGGVKILSKEEFEHSSTKELQDIFSTHNLLITGNKAANKYPHFGAEEIGKLFRRTQAIEVNDMSVDIYDERSNADVGTKRLRLVNRAEILHQFNQPDGKALNALSIAAVNRVHLPFQLSSDNHAWQMTVGLPLCKGTEPELVHEFHFSLVATAGAHSDWHCDAEGVATMIEIKNEEGKKLWVIATPPKSNPDFANIDTFLGDLDVGQVNDDRWSMVVIPLTAGDMLLMRPNTPHYVFTPTPTIAHGGHFLATSTIRQTCYGLIHTTLSGHLITNTTHAEKCRKLLGRLVSFYHEELLEVTADPTPDHHLIEIGTKKGLIDFLTLYNAVTLFPVFSAISSNERDIREPLKDQHNWELSQNNCAEILSWFQERYDVSMGSMMVPPSEIRTQYLSGQIRAILRYQEKLDASDYDTNATNAPNATKVLKGMQSRLAMLVELIEGFLEDGASHVAAYRRALIEDPEDPYLKSFAWSEDMGLNVSLKKKLKGRHSTEHNMQRSEKRARGA
ncbi:hypothetical protein CPB84DRAFT_1748939 [Gymnopilus junonius]|uniref:JmjC domain-containing protein n=1 Tax=Gymnopilus junonius TaxID=109634 RepID=A0A9P5NHA1_GYMJU|nr:hypothetical protein CPB84DRAFT_1748939 [Gymnopilus junonius]